MPWLIDTTSAALGFALLLTPVHLVVFFVQRHRTRSNAEAARFVGVGIATIVGFVVALSVAGPLFSLLGTGPESDCERLGGTAVAVPQPDGTSGAICVVR